MIGYAYNPFDMKHKVVEILNDCIQEYKKNEQAYFEKYGVDLPLISPPRHFNIFQTRYLGFPKLLRHSDKHYKDYLKIINLDKQFFNYGHRDLFYWEFRFES